MRVFFVQNKLMLEADRLCSNRIYNEDLAVVKEVYQNKILIASNEKQLVENEKAQLQAMVCFFVHKFFSRCFLNIFDILFLYIDL